MCSFCLLFWDLQLPRVFSSHGKWQSSRAAGRHMWCLLRLQFGTGILSLPPIFHGPESKLYRWAQHWWAWTNILPALMRGTTNSPAKGPWHICLLQGKSEEFGTIIQYTQTTSTAYLLKILQAKYLSFYEWVTCLILNHSLWPKICDALIGYA